MNLGILRSFKLIILLASLLSANTLDFSLIKKGKEATKDNTLLVIGGIQGDEPGGFLAASILAMDYEITKGNVWVVPNLNFPSIIRRSRGLNGDMNRKFKTIKESDPDYKAVKGIKDLIADPSVSLIVNLHDGSGFYRSKYINEYFNTQRWGNSCIIDQESLKDVKYGDLDGIANRVAKSINVHLQKPNHKYHVKNTKTRLGDKEMLKSLTYYAINEGKAAFANEASKSLKSHVRAYYHLLALEEYMRIMGIEFKRNFPLSLNGVKTAINKEIEVSLFDKKVVLNLNEPRSVIKYVPMPKTKNVKYETSNPLAAIVKEKGGYSVHYGNRRLTKLVPQYFDYTEDRRTIQVDIDGKIQDIILGSIVRVNNYFNVVPDKSVRVNAIGYVNKKHRDESGLNIRKKYFLNHYSIDRGGNTYRVEVYDRNGKDKYAGMFLVEFSYFNVERKNINVVETEMQEKEPFSGTGK